MRRIIPIIFWTFFGTFLYLSFYRPVETGDVWWHLSTGRWILEHGRVPVHDVFVFDPSQPPCLWIHTQWLGSTLLYLWYLAGGITGLMVFRAIFFMAIIGVFAVYARRRVPQPILILLILLITYGLSSRILLRPLIFNFLFIQIFLIILLNFYRTRNVKTLFLLPLLGILWVNIHLGSFIYGLSLIMIFCLASMIQYVIGRWTHAQDTDLRKKQSASLALGTALYILTFFLNPYGLRGALHPVKILLIPDYINFYQYVGVITEMQPPTILLQTQAGLPLVIILVLSFGILLLNRHNRILYWLLFGLSIFIFSWGVRGSAFFVLINIYLITECLTHRSVKNQWDKISRSKMLDQGILIVLTVLLILKLPGLIRPKVPPAPKHTPLAEAVQYLKMNHLEGPVFNDDTYGGYLIWSSYPRLRPFIDGRQLDQRHFFQIVDILSEPSRY